MTVRFLLMLTVAIVCGCPPREPNRATPPILERIAVIGGQRNDAVCALAPTAGGAVAFGVATAPASIGDESIGTVPPPAGQEIADVAFAAMISDGALAASPVVFEPEAIEDGTDPIVFAVVGASSADGGFLAAGAFRGTATMPDGIVSGPAGALFIGKADGGSWEWLRAFRSTGTGLGDAEILFGPRPIGLVTDGWGNIFLVASAARQIDLGGGALGPEEYGPRLIIARFSDSGEHVLSRAFPGDLPFWGAVTGLTDADDGGIALLAALGDRAYGTVDLGFGALPRNDRPESVLMRLSSSLEVQWWSMVPGIVIGPCIGDGLGLDVPSLVVRGGVITTATIHDFQVDGMEVPPVFLQRFALENGASLGLAMHGSPGGTRGPAVLALSDGRAFLVGTFLGVSRFGDTSLVAPVGETHVYLAETTHAGDVAMAWDIATNIALQAAVADTAGGLWIAGNFEGRASLLGDELVGRGGQDAFAARIVP